MIIADEPTSSMSPNGVNLSEPDVGAVEGLPTIMVVDDDAINRRLMERWVAPKASRVIACDSAEAAIKLLESEKVDMLISDIQMQGMSGLDLAATLKTQKRSIPIILITAYGDQAALLNALNIGIDHFLIKPILQAALISYVDKLSESLATRRRLRAAREEIVAKNALLERARRKEQETGAAIQRMVLYRTPEPVVAGVQCLYELHPAQIVNGDYLDHFVHSPTVFDVAIGDAMGKGLTAALLAAGVKTGLMRALSDKGVAMPAGLPDLGDVFRILQGETYTALSQLDSFVTLLYARIDTQKGLLSWVDCGHGKIILQRKHLQQVILLSGDNMPLGLSSRETHVLRHCPLFEGDRLYLMTDGLTEVQLASGENLDFGGVAKLVNEHRDATLAQSVATVMQEVERLEPQNTAGADDKTLLAMEYGRAAQNTPQRLFYYQSFTAAMSSLPLARDWIAGALEQLCAHQFSLGQASEGIEIGQANETLTRWKQEFILGASECYSNAVRHGLTSESTQIEVTLSCADEQVYLEIVYTGAYFAPTEKNKRLQEEPSENGYGIFLISSIFDDVVFHSDRAGFQAVALYKKWP